MSSALKRGPEDRRELGKGLIDVHLILTDTETRGLRRWVDMRFEEMGRRDMRFEEVDRRDMRFEEVGRRDMRFEEVGRRI